MTTETLVFTSPNAKFMWSHPARILALGFGAGLSRFAPGTVGTAWAWLTFLLLQGCHDRW